MGGWANRFKLLCQIWYVGIIDELAKGLADMVSSVARISIQPLEGESVNVGTQKVYPPTLPCEPLIDIIREGRKIRVVATLPGIRREDVWYEIRGGVLGVEVTGCGRVFRKEIPCKVRPDRIAVRSERVNNSVIDLVFERRIAKGSTRKRRVANRT